MSFLQIFHGELRWLIVAVGLIALVRFGIGWANNGRFGLWDNRLWLAAIWLLRLQLVLGLVLIIWKFAAGIYVGAAWHGPVAHALTLIIAIGLMEMFAARLKRHATDRQKLQTATTAIGVVALLVVIGVTFTPAGW
jgi:hypothetical protein